MYSFAAQGLLHGCKLDAAEAAGRDQLQLLPVTYAPFKFESRRLRIDWRLLHGVEINKVIRDTDLDTLERHINCITWGDIEAEDTLHLSEQNFIKVFRLAQLLLEYLLYVQDNLKHTNSVLEQSRSRSLLQLQSLNSRCRELHVQLKQSKRELRRARRTVKTMELMAAAVGGGAAPQPAAAPAAAAAPAGVSVTLQATMQEQQQQQQQRQGLGGQSTVPVMMPLQGTHGMVCLTPGELLLQAQLTELTERLAVAGCEAERLREEREELEYQVRYLHDILASKTDGVKSSQRHFSPGRSSLLASRSSPYGWRHSAGGTAGRESMNAGRQQQHQQDQQDQQQLGGQQQQQNQQLVEEMERLEVQLEQLRTENLGLRQQLLKQQEAETCAEDAVTASLRAQLDDKFRELLQLQAELKQRDASLAVFKQAEESLRQQLEQLQKQLSSPEATTPSFVAKQRQSLAMAETKAGKAQTQITELMQENVALAQQVESLKAKLAAGQAADHRSHQQQQQQQDGEADAEDAVAAAEELLDSSRGGAGKAAAVSAAKGSRSSSPQQQQEQTDWKLQEIERLQNENRLLQQKVASLQQQVHDLERLNHQLDRQAVKARQLGLAASLDAAAGTSGSSIANVWATGSVNSSGPREELTAADLAAALGDRAAIDAGPAAAVGSEEEEEGSEAEEQGAARPVAIAVKPAVVAQQLRSVEADAIACVVKKKAAAVLHGGSAVGVCADDATTGESTKIAAFRPEQATAAAQQAAADQVRDAAAALVSPPVSSRSAGNAAAAAAAGPAAAGAGGSISQESVQQMKVLMAELAAMPADLLASEYGEACADWDTPYDFDPGDEKNPPERPVFEQLLPYEMQGMPGLLMATPHSQQELSINKARLLSDINKQLDGQLASYGIHPGRLGLTQMEFMAAMRMLHERRDAWASNLPPELSKQVDIVRVGLLLNPYNAMQAALQQQPVGPDGKRHLPGPIGPSLTSAVRPPASMLPAGPPSVRVGRGVAGGVMSNAATYRNTLQVNSTASPAPSASRYQASELDSEDESHPYYARSPGGPTAASPVAPAAAAAAASHVTSRAPSYSATTYYAATGSGRSSPELSQQAMTRSAASGGFSPMSAALHAKQQLKLSPRATMGGQGSDPAAAMAIAGVPSPASSATGSPWGPGTAGSSRLGPGVSSGNNAEQQVSPKMSQPAAPKPSSYIATGSLVQPGHGGSPRGVGGIGGGGAAAQKVQGGTPQAAAVAMKQYLNTSFNDSDDF